MSSTRISPCWHKYRQTLFIACYCLILFASSPSLFSSTHLLFIAEGRPISNPIEVSKEEGGVVVSKVRVIGSRPPRCEGRCRNCGHCEAVQVPVTPPRVQSHGSHYSGAAITYNSRGDDLSNYKPMSWKCKCGDYFFNP